MLNEVLNWGHFIKDNMNLCVEEKCFGHFYSPKCSIQSPTYLNDIIHSIWKFASTFRLWMLMQINLTIMALIIYVDHQNDRL